VDEDPVHGSDLQNMSKWSTPDLIARNYTGAAASDLLHQFEPTGPTPNQGGQVGPGGGAPPQNAQLGGFGMPMPTPGVMCSMTGLYIPPGVDATQPWYEIRDEDYCAQLYCLLCGSYCTDDHVTCKKHKTRESNPNSYRAYWVHKVPAHMLTNFTAAPQVQYTQQVPQMQHVPMTPMTAAVASMDETYAYPWFEQQAYGEWYCHLCKKVATEEHLRCQMHLNRSSTPAYYGFPGAAPAGLGMRHPPPPPPHVRVQNYMEVAPLQPLAALEDYEPPQTSASGWQTHTCSEDGKLYYHHPGRNLTQWEEPEDVREERIQKEQQQRQQQQQQQQQQQRKEAAQAAAKQRKLGGLVGGSDREDEEGVVVSLPPILCTELTQ